MSYLEGSPLGPGDTVGGYRVEALIGRGGMGAVYRAAEEGLERKVALKVIAPEVAQDERFRERFLRESKIAASLDHPHVIPVYRAGEEDGLLFLAMRHVEGTDLARLVAEEGPLEPRRALELLSQVAEALDAAHEKGLVHRDVKPSNVLIASAGGSEHCYLGDFGLTKRTGSLSGVSVAGNIVGTLEYVAPEQITGEPLDERSDVYSLGCVLYECLTGQVPFLRATDIALLWAHVHEEPTPPSTIRRFLPGELDAVLLRALAKHPGERFSSAGELLEACSAGDAIAVSPVVRSARTNLPRPLSSFVGREAELAEVCSLIERGGRLLTLTGPGGTGKTRLALEAARRIASQHEVDPFWIGLAPLRDSTLVTATIAQTLEAKGDLADHIGERRMLLLVDNLEHVIDSAPELSTLLERCPNLTLLVTSRELLRLQGEIEYQVPPLAEPDAALLFCERSRLEPAPEITELCTRLDNLPLAVELAAARAKAMSPAQTLERLSGHLDLLRGGRDADPRQQGLRATIDWSYRLLSDEEQRIFRRLSVFGGGCTLEAAEEVAHADVETMQSLVEKSLLRFSNERYWMLETIREFAREELDASTEAEPVHRRHATFFLDAAQVAEPRVQRADVLAALSRDEANFRVALIYSRDHVPNLMLQLVGFLWRWWHYRAQFEEGRSWLEQALSRAGTERSLTRAHALRGLAALLVAPEDAERSRTLLEEAIEIHREHGDDAGLSRCLNNLGLLLASGPEQGDLDRATELLREALSLTTDLRERGQTIPPTSFVVGGLASIALHRGDLAEARRLTNDGLEMARAEDNDVSVAAAHSRLAWLAALEGNYEEAARFLRRSLYFAREIESRRPGNTLAVAAVIDAHRGRRTEAAKLLGALEAHRDRVSLVMSDDNPIQRVIAATSQALDRAGFGWALAEGRELSFAEMLDLALSATDLATEAERSSL